MSIDAQDLMGRLFARHRMMGGTPAQLAAWAGLSRSRISELEQGVEPSVEDFERLSRGLAIDPAAVFAGEDENPRRTLARFRTAAGSPPQPAPADIRLLALAAEQGRLLAYLLRLLGRQIALEPFRDVCGLGPGEQPWETGYQLGEAAREHLLPNPEPASELERGFNELGTHVARSAFSSQDIDVASIWEPGSAPVIVLNAASGRSQYPLARRAILSHELCHLLHDGTRDGELITRLSWGTEGSGNYADGLEQRARGFAPAFLAPRPWVRTWHDSLPRSSRRTAYDSVASLANCWGLSFEGAAWHAKNTGIIEASEAERLAQLQDRPRIEATNSFEAAAPGVPPRMIDDRLPDQAEGLWDGWAAEVVLEAYAEGAISLGRAREILTWK